MINIFKIVSESLIYIVSSPINNGIILIGYKHGNIYMVDLDDHSMKNGQYLVIMNTKVNKIN